MSGEGRLANDEKLLGFAGRAAIVTGAASGIGRACALLLARLGSDVCIVDRDGDAAKAAAQAVEELGRTVMTVAGDAREPATARDAARSTLEHFGHIDALVNNVGGMFHAKAEEITENGWSAVIRTNLDSAFHFSKAVAPAMLANGGAIVNVASVAGMTASPGAAHYGAAKAGLINLTRTLALEWAPRVRVNCVAPDFIRTVGTESLMSDAYRERVQKLVPLGRLGAPDDVALVVAFLASDMAAFVTGQTLAVDGGSLFRGRVDFMADEG